MQVGVKNLAKQLFIRVLRVQYSRKGGVMKICKTLRFFSPILMIGFLAGYGCGGGSDSAARAINTTNSGSGVGIAGSVATPTTSSASISVGASVSKGVTAGKSVDKGISESVSEKPVFLVSKATTDTPAKNAKITITDSAGEVLDTCKCNNQGELIGCNVDPAKLEVDKLIFIKPLVGTDLQLSAVVDLSGKTAGETADAGTIDADDTVIADQLLLSCGGSSSAACTTTDEKNRAYFKTINNVSGTTAGVADQGGIQKAYQEMIRGCMASGVHLSPSEIIDMLKGSNSSLISKCQSLAGLSLDNTTLTNGMKNFPTAVSGIISDSAFAKSLLSGGEDAFKKMMGAFFLKQPPANMGIMAGNPAVYKTMMATYATDVASGQGAAVFSRFSDASFLKSFGSFGDGLTVANMAQSGKADALKKVWNASTFSGSENFAKMGESWRTLAVSGNSSTEFDLWTSKASTYAKKCTDNPSAWGGSAGAAAWDSFGITMVQNPTAATAGAVCTKDADCPTGQVCTLFNTSTGGVCFVSCTSNCVYGSKCSTNSQCQSGFCGADSSCSANTIGGVAVDPLGAVLKNLGETCAINRDCNSGNCSGGVCSSATDPRQTGAAAFAGFYKKTSGCTTTCTCTIAFQIDGPAGSTKFSVQPADTNNPASNTFYGGNLDITGTGPLFLTAVAVTNSSGTAGTLTCTGAGGSTELTVSGARITGTCAFGGGLTGSCTIDHTKL